MELHAASSSVTSIEIVEPEVEAEPIRLYPYRWFILALYSLTIFLSVLVCYSLFTVSDATSVYYGITQGELIWSSIGPLLLHLIVSVPSSLLPSKVGLRTTIILGAMLNAVGASIMIGGTHRNGFPYFVAGQATVGLTYAILAQVAPEISAVWFGENEQALSTSIGIMMGNAGAAVGFLQPALMISNVDPEKNIDFIGQKLRQLIYSQAALCIFLLVLIIIFFKKSPPSPPTLYQAIRTEDTTITLSKIKMMSKSLFKDKVYLTYSNVFALHSAILALIPMLLNPIISWKFPHHDAAIGWLGFSGVIAGVIGSAIFSIIVDKTKEYRKMIIVLGTSSIFVWLGFTETLANWNNLPLVCSLFIISVILVSPLGPILLEIISKTTYPISESISCVFPITVGRIHMIPLTFVFGYLVDHKHYHILCLTIAGLVSIAFIFVYFKKVQLKRIKFEEEISPNAEQKI